MGQNLNFAVPDSLLIGVMRSPRYFSRVLCCCDASAGREEVARSRSQLDGLEKELRDGHLAEERTSETGCNRARAKLAAAAKQCTRRRAWGRDQQRLSMIRGRHDSDSEPAGSYCAGRTTWPQHSTRPLVRMPQLCMRAIATPMKEPLGTLVS